MSNSHLNSASIGISANIHFPRAGGGNIIMGNKYKNKIYSTPNSELDIRLISLSRSRIISISAVIILCIVPIFLIYEEWIGHFVDWIASHFFEQGSCSDADNFTGCENVMQIYSTANKIGYRIYSFIFYGGTSFVVANHFMKNCNFRLVETLLLFGMFTGTPFTAYYLAGHVKMESAIFHFMLIMSGFLVSLVWIKKQESRSQRRSRVIENGLRNKDSVITSSASI